MNTMSVTTYYQAIRGRIVQEIEVLEASALEGTAIEDWVKYYMDKYAFVPIQLKPEAPVLEERVNKFHKKDFFDFDLNRFLLDQTAESNYSIGRGLNYKNKIYVDERIKTCEDKRDFG